MRITYLGHSCFLVEARDQTRIMFDPYLPGSYDGAVMYEPIDEPADLVLSSHDHPDHYVADGLPGNPRTVMHPVEERVGEVRITGVLVAHDETGGSERGQNTIMCIDDGDLRLVHLGDLGHLLDTATAKKVGPVDVLLIPVGGFFTIDHEAAAAVVDLLSPRLVIPMHYKTPKIGFPIAGVEDFLGTQTVVKHNPDPTLEVTKATLPAERTTLVLPYAR